MKLGIVGVYITGYILERTDYNWSIIFLLAASMYIIAAFLYIGWSEAEQIDYCEQERLKLEKVGDKFMKNYSDIKLMCIILLLPSIVASCSIIYSLF
jgi:hypothetical protein